MRGREQQVSVAGCLGYDVLELMKITSGNSFIVSVAGCLGYDVLVVVVVVHNKF